MSQAIKATAIDPPRGSGFGPFIEGDPITSPTQVAVGDLLCSYSARFNACNLVRVTRTEFEVAGTQHFYGTFVDPRDPSKPRMGSTGDINFWDWEINPASASFWKVLHRAVMPAGPVRRLELRASDRKTAVEATDTPEGRQMLEWFARRNFGRFTPVGTNPVNPTNPSARVTAIQHDQPPSCPLLVEHSMS